MFFGIVSRKAPDSDSVITARDPSFQKGLNESQAFLNKFGIPIDFRGKSVIDIGCGLGSTCIVAALRGAKRVTGVDIERERLSFARDEVKRNYPKLASVVSFLEWDDMGEKEFDIILSKDSFEHFQEPDKMLRTWDKMLTHDGSVYLGFGPLWKSPYGGHIHYKTDLPWAHLIFPEQIVYGSSGQIKRLEHDPSDLGYIGLNKMTFKQVLQIIRKSNFDIVSIRVNVSSRKAMKLLNIMRRIPFLEEYFTFNIYSVLRKKGPNNLGTKCPHVNVPK